MGHEWTSRPAMRADLFWSTAAYGQPLDPASTVRADDLPGEGLRIRCRFRPSHEAGPVLRFDQLPFAGKAWELEHLDIGPARALDRDCKALHHRDDRRESQARDASALTRFRRENLARVSPEPPSSRWPLPRSRLPRHDRSRQPGASVRECAPGGTPALDSPATPPGVTAAATTWSATAAGSSASGCCSTSSTRRSSRDEWEFCDSSW